MNILSILNRRMDRLPTQKRPKSQHLPSKYQHTINALSGQSN